MNFGFRVDSNKEIGGGHFYRSLNFSEFFNKKNKVFFFSKKISPKQKILLKEKNYIFKKISNQKNDFENIKKFVFDSKIDYLIIDNYKISSITKKKIKSLVKKLIIIDDRINVSHYSDILINSNYLNQSDLLKIKRANKDSKKFLGPECNFNFSPNTVRKPKKKIKRLFIFFGMIDKENYTYKVLNLIKNIKGIKILVVIGIFNKNKRKIFQTFKNFKNIKLYQNLKTNQMIEKLSHVDFTIGSGGVNLIEKISMGLPSLVISKIKNQKNGLKNLKSKNLILHKNLSDLSENFFIDLLTIEKENPILKIKKNCYNEAVRLKKKKKIFFKEIKKAIEHN
tara:strand:+ start:18765 stop:19778 length:1014 start_codon:yes stop_codon:yes gene_type:complete